ncbi:hypothetical protein GSI_10146 [Ganoderma sinense ZZ0214-1]|uniref:F-box domain-containing protein n=1 Tax=Ganoderma sinense ZZ0214-1 TaxID=1077348 RepID=A0A2G8RZU1_9APHY|nr:hypothetical protein GSI_10146 [Ganoderma sinense ZZ0214-1]
MQNDHPERALSLYLQVGDLAFSESTLVEEHNLGQRLLADDDRVALSQLAPDKVQEWCLSRIAHYHHHNGVLRERYGAAARNAISKNKSHIRALRAAYNDAAPIHRHLPPEVLMEIFSHVDPVVAMMPRPWVPLLRICRYWRRLLFRTAQFWANLLSLPIWTASILRRHMQRFRTALARSGHESLTLSVPYYSQGIVDILMPHASRLSSFDAGPSLLLDPEEMAHNKIGQELLCVSHHPTNMDVNMWRTSPLTFSFTLFLNLCSLQLQHTYFDSPAAPYLSLCHLKLDHCTVRPSSSTGRVPTLCAIHDTLDLFPNLETLSLTCCLSEKNPGTVSGMLPVPGVTKTIHLPRLRHLELEDVCGHIPRFLSHVAFPPTAALALCPLRTHDPTVQLFTGVDLSPAPHAALHLEIRGVFGRIYHACYETRGNGVRSVRVTLDDASLDSRTIAHFARELVAVLAPARGLTSLTTVGLPNVQLRSYWDDLRAAFVCPVLDVLALDWRPPVGADLGPQGDWGVLRDRDDSRHLGDGAFGILPSLQELCDVLRACLGARTGGRSPLHRLEVTVRPCSVDRDKEWEEVVLEGWQIALAEDWIRDKLSDLVEDVVAVPYLD